MGLRRTIEEVTDLETGELISSSFFFKKPFDELTIIRSELEKANQGHREKWLVCAVCGEKLRILGGKHQIRYKKGKNLHFAHLHNSNDCPIKTTSKYTKDDINRMKYRGASESYLHQTLKGQISAVLHLNQETKGQISSIQIEKVIRSLEEKEWKKPDINTIFNSYRLAIELQLSTTWLDVITSRQHFYNKEKIYILWIFNSFDKDDDVRNLTKSDIFYTNNYNAFVFNEETHKRSISENDIILKCYYLKCYAEDGKFKTSWVNEYIKLDELIFDSKTFKVFFYDYNSHKDTAEREIKDYLRKQADLEREDREELNRRHFRKSSLENELEEAESNLKEIDEEHLALLSKKDKFKYEIDNLARKIRDHKDEADRIFLQLAYSNRYMLPKAVLDIVDAQQEVLEDIVKAQKDLLHDQTELQKRIQAIDAFEVKEINGIRYQVLDKQKHWPYIKENHSSLYSYKINQATNLFSVPQVQPLVLFKLDNLQFAHDVMILGSFHEKRTMFQEESNNNELILIKHEEDIQNFRENFTSLVQSVLADDYKLQLLSIKDELKAIHAEQQKKAQALMNKKNRIRHIKDELRLYRDL